MLLESAGQDPRLSGDERRRAWVRLAAMAAAAGDAAQRSSDLEQAALLLD